MSHARPRTVVAIVAALVSVMAVVAVAVLVRDHRDHRRGAATGAPSSSPFSIPSPTFTPTGRTDVRLTLDGLPEGGPARSAWLQGQEVHLQDGTTAVVPRPEEGGSYLNLERYHGGWIGVYEEANGAPVTDVIGQAPRAGGSEEFAVRLDGSAFAWNSGGGTLTVSSTSSATPDVLLTISHEPILTPVGWTDPQHLVYDDFRRGGAVYVTDLNDAETTLYGDGVRVAGARYAASASETTHMIAVGTQASQGKCQQVQSADGSVVAFQTCGYSLGGFSSDGRFIIATPSPSDSHEVVVLDASSGEVVLDAQTSPRLDILDLAWDGDTESLLAAVRYATPHHGPLVEGMVRVGLDGSQEQVPGVDPNGGFVAFLSRG